MRKLLEGKENHVSDQAMTEEQRQAADSLAKKEAAAAAIRGELGAHVRGRGGPNAAGKELAAAYLRDYALNNGRGSNR